MALSNSTLKNLISAKKLKLILKNTNLRIIDCRWFLGKKEKGINLYKQNHIPGSIYFDIEKISNSNSDLPHMFPSSEVFFSFTNKYGINKRSKIVIYDQIGFFSSSRVWFMFKYFGFENVAILDGGFKTWKQRRYKLEISKKKIKYSQCYGRNSFPSIVVDLRTLKKKISNKKSIIIDARPSLRFNGKVPEPRPNLKKGKIQSSINICFSLISDDNGLFKKNVRLNDIFKNLNKNKEIICYCGSGITACNILFALNIMNFKNLKLYDGSWAEWGKIKKLQS